MKKSLFIILFLFVYTLGFANNPGEKTFLVLFDKSELKNHKTSTDYIEMSLMNIFKTKAYTGNSDAAILVKVPYDNLDECQLGYIFVRLNNKTVVPLQDIALKIIDLDQSKNTFNYLLSSLDEEKLIKNKKSSKALKTTPIP
ncbi:hypothetical protein [Cecembia sp.]|uniref:hypothetical protein n=1 Tax=Cecembia sp. TaxID=1898110 RepID=UPI0025BB1C86|nr:hypothetical protein [Cecembia sp.]